MLFRSLFARVGTPHCPEHGLPLAAQSVAQMVDHVLALPEDTRLLVLAPVVAGRRGEQAELLPERFQDEEFRTRFAESVQKDVRRLEEVTARLSQLGDLAPGERLAVDVARILDELLEAHREALQQRRVLVLKELDRHEPFVVADPAQLRVALECLLDKALALVPERGDAYVASRHHASGLRGGPSVRILVRFQGPPVDRDDAARGLTVAAASLDLIVSEALVRAQGGTFHLDASDSGETVVVLDLPAPG